jgi:hypothetical protein
MLKRLKNRRVLSPALLALVLGCFFLPFATISCGPEQVNFTGVQLATGTVPDSGSGDLNKKVESGGQFYALLALAAILGAGVLAAYRSPSRTAFLLSELAFLALCWLYVQAGLEMATADVHVGYLLALAVLLASMSAHVRAMRGRGLWAAVTTGIPGMVHPIAFLVVSLVVGLIYLARADSLTESSSQELLPPSSAQTTGKNDSSIVVSPTRR